MEKQQAKRTKPPACNLRKRKLDEMMRRLEDIDSKVNHVIFRLKDSLHHAKKAEEEAMEVKQ
jgi:tetrahydromethanopterin S-methyltransferase subunit G